MATDHVNKAIEMSLELKLFARWPDSRVMPRKPLLFFSWFRGLGDTDDKSCYGVKLSEIFAIGCSFFQAVVCSWEHSYQSHNLEKTCRSHAPLFVSHFCGPDLQWKEIVCYVEKIHTKWNYYCFLTWLGPQKKVHSRSSIFHFSSTKSVASTPYESLHSAKSLLLSPSCVITAQYCAILSSELILPITTLSAPGLPPEYVLPLKIGNSRYGAEQENVKPS